MTTVAIASNNGHALVVQALLAHSRVNPTADNNAAMKWACENSYAGMDKLHPRARSCLNIELKRASRNDHIDVVRVLLAQDPNAIYSSAAIHCA